MDLQITNNKGFRITLPNKYVVSVQFGVGNYGTNYKKEFGDDCTSANTAETAVINPDGDFVPFKGGDVQAWQTAEQILETLNWANSLK
jgi:hypothetical protein